MIKKLLLENFMAHSRTEIEFGDEVTVLTGANNSGKSALVEGLRCLATNPAPRHVIRHGEKSARVEVTLGDDTRVAWVRKKLSAIYEVYAPGAEEPEVYAKFGRKPPEDVLGLLALNLLELETGQDIDVHIGNQREPVFLLNEPSSAQAAFLAASTESAHLLAMQNALKTRVRTAKNEQKQVLARMEHVVAGLDRLEALPDISLDMERVEREEERLAVLEREMPELEQAGDALVQTRSTLEALQQRRDVLTELTTAQPLFPAHELADHLRQQRQLSGYRERASQVRASLRTLAAPGELADTAGLKLAISMLREAEENQHDFKQKQKVFQPLADAGEPFDTTGLALFQKQFEALVTEKKQLEQRGAALNALVQAPDFEDLASLVEILAELEGIEAQRRQMKRQLAESAQKMKEFSKQAENVLERAGTCPLCGGDLDAAAFWREKADDRSEVANG